MRNAPRPIRLLFALLAVCAGAIACGTSAAGTPPPTINTSAPAMPSAQPAPDTGSGPVPATPVQFTTNGDPDQNQPQQLSTAEYKSWAADLYNQELTLIHQEQQTLANETAPAATRAAQITNQLLPQLQRLLAQAQAVQPTDGSTADLHQHLINALQLMIAAYQDFATGLTQNDTAALARARSELTNEAQELGIWVHAVPQL